MKNNLDIESIVGCVMLREGSGNYIGMVQDSTNMGCSCVQCIA